MNYVVRRLEAIKRFWNRMALQTGELRYYAVAGT